jgi:hypothetical protein
VSLRLPWSHAGAAVCSRFRFQPVRVRIPSAQLALNSENARAALPSSWLLGAKPGAKFHSVQWLQSAQEASNADSPVMTDPHHGRRPIPHSGMGVQSPWLGSLALGAKRVPIFHSVQWLEGAQEASDTDRLDDEDLSQTRSRRPNGSSAVPAQRQMSASMAAPRHSRGGCTPIAPVGRR